MATKKAVRRSVKKKPTQVTTQVTVKNLGALPSCKMRLDVTDRSVRIEGQAEGSAVVAVDPHARTLRVVASTYDVVELKFDADTWALLWTRMEG